MAGVRVYLTERGREIQGPIADEIRKVARVALRGLPKDQKVAMYRALEQMRANLADPHA